MAFGKPIAEFAVCFCEIEITRLAQKATRRGEDRFLLSADELWLALPYFMQLKGAGDPR